MASANNYQQEANDPTRPYDDCLEWLAARGRSRHTIRAYEQGLAEFANLLEQRGVDIIDVGETELCRYLVYMSGKPVAGLSARQRLSPATQKLRLAAVSQWFNYLVRMKALATNPRRQLDERLQDTSDEEAWVPSDEEWLRFLNELALESLRTRLLMVMAYDGALRSSTVVNLERRDVLLKDRVINVRAEISKDGGKTVVNLSAVGCLLYKIYMAVWTTIPREGHPDEERIFRSESNRNRNRAITVSAFSKLVSKVATRARLPRFTPHTFRHLRLTHMAEAGINILEIQRYAAHKSLRSTERYLHLRGELALKIAQNQYLQQEDMKLLGLIGDL